MTRLSPAQIIYLSHGGGPLPILGPGHRAMAFTIFPSQLRWPEAILGSAHWGRAQPLLGAVAPLMLYDYYGFLREAYAITALRQKPRAAGRIVSLLGGAAFLRGRPPARFDHGCSSSPA